jgi:ankyrin repeat protein
MSREVGEKSERNDDDDDEMDAAARKLKRSNVTMRLAQAILNNDVPLISDLLSNEVDASAEPLFLKFYVSEDGSFVQLASHGKVPHSLEAIHANVVVLAVCKWLRNRALLELLFRAFANYLASSSASLSRRSVLYFAAQCGNVEAIKLLHAVQIDVNKADSGGRTPLDVAARFGHIEATRVLLECGADVNRVDRGQHTALHRAAKYGRADVARALVAVDGVDAGVRDNNGMSALHRAARFGHADVARVLVDMGAERIDVNARDGAGRTALHVAAKYRRADITRMLLSAERIDANVLDNDGAAPLHHVAESGDLASFEALMTVDGIVLDPLSKAANTPLAIAARQGHAGIVRALLAHPQVDPFARVHSFKLPFALAACHRRVDIVKLFALRCDSERMLAREPLPLRNRMLEKVDVFRRFQVHMRQIEGVETLLYRCYQRMLSAQMSIDRVPKPTLAMLRRREFALLQQLDISVADLFTLSRLF